MQFNRYLQFYYYFQNISREKMKRLFEGLKTNTHLEYLSLANVDLYDASAEVNHFSFQYSALNQIYIFASYKGSFKVWILMGQYPSLLTNKSNIFNYNKIFA